VVQRIDGNKLYLGDNGRNLHPGVSGFVVTLLDDKPRQQLVIDKLDTFTTINKNGKDYEYTQALSKKPELFLNYDSKPDAVKYEAGRLVSNILGVWKDYQKLPSDRQSQPNWTTGQPNNLFTNMTSQTQN
jgi:hypothetical protein